MTTMSYTSTPDNIHFHKSPVNIPHHSTPSGHFSHTQLEFNLNPYTKNAGSQIHKPRPIIIEKLLPYSTKPVVYKTSGLFKERDNSHIPETMLSSDKLAFAVQLAKIDIKKLKNMLNSDNGGEVNKSLSVPQVPQVTKKKLPVESSKSKKVKKVNEMQKESKAKPQRHILHLYPERKEHEISDESAKVPQQNTIKQKGSASNKDNEMKSLREDSAASNKDNEVRRLHKDIAKYSQALDLVVQSLNKQKFVDTLNVDDELKKERERNIIRAEEQGNRSTRMLYMLQRKVEDLQNELISKKSNIRQTKKSQYVSNLASAHRAAVRALQMFVNHAPLYYNNTGKLPPMYNALALLIQQLTSLSSGISLGVEGETMNIIEDLIASLSTATERKPIPHKENEGVHKKKYPIKKAKQTMIKPVDRKQQYLHSRIDWLKKRADELNIKSFQESEESTPDRAAMLQHAIKSIDEDETSTMQNIPVSRPQPKAKQKPKSSVLLPSELKNKRMKIIPSRPYHPQPPANMNYAASTVISKIREKPPVERKEKTPPSTPKKSVGFTDEQSTPKKRDSQIIEEARALISPAQKKSPGRSDRSPNRSDTEFADGDQPTATKIKLMEKEVSHEKWLQRRKLDEISKLDAIGKRNTKWFENLKNEFEQSNHLVKHAEEQIRERLKPLLEKAEVISQDEARREEQYKTSLNKRLADIASQKAMSEGERLAEYILDDLIGEAAIDIQKIECDEHAEMKAAFMFDQQNLEIISERLEAFEIEEENIRRHWKSLRYSELDSTRNEKNIIGGNKDCLNSSHITGRSVMFTAPLHEERPLPPMPDGNEKGNVPVRNEMHIPDGPLNTIFLFKQRFEHFLAKSIHNSWSVDPHDVLEEISDQILDVLLADISEEMNDNCSRFVEDIYEKEFLSVTR